MMSSILSCLSIWPYRSGCLVVGFRMSRLTRIHFGDHFIHTSIRLLCEPDFFMGIFELLGGFIGSRTSFGELVGSSRDSLFGTWS